MKNLTDSSQQAEISLSKSLQLNRSYDLMQAADKLIQWALKAKNGHQQKNEGCKSKPQADQM